MYNEFNQHKKSDAVKWVIVFMAIILLTVSVLYLATDGFVNINTGWFDKTKENEDNSTTLPPASDTEDGLDNDPLEPIDTETSVIDNGSIKVYNSELVKLCASPVRKMVNGKIAVTSVTVEAYISSTADNSGLEWEVRWTDIEDCYGLPTDFVTVTPQNDTKTIISIDLVQPFTNQIMVCCRSLDNPNATAYCLVDYAKKLSPELTVSTEADVFFVDNPVQDQLNVVKGVQLLDQNEFMHRYDTEYMFLHPEFMEGSLESEMSSYECSLTLSEAFCDALFECHIDADSSTKQVELTGILSACDILNSLLGEVFIMDSISDSEVQTINNLNYAAKMLDGDLAFTLHITVITNHGQEKTYDFEFAFDPSTCSQYTEYIDLSEYNVVF